MVATHHDDGEGEIARQVRALVGPAARRDFACTRKCCISTLGGRAAINLLLEEAMALIVTDKEDFGAISDGGGRIDHGWLNKWIRQFARVPLVATQRGLR